MSMPTWPAGVAQRPIRKGFSQSDKDNLFRASTERGPGKTRPKQSRREVIVSCTIPATDSEKKVLQSFFRDELRDGAIRFKWPGMDDVIGDEEEYQYKAIPPFKWSPRGAEWELKLQIKGW